jgi:hypothetical protein
MMLRTVLLNALISIVIVACGLTAYDGMVAKPGRQIGVVDVAEVFRLKERQFTELITKAGKTDAERAAVASMAGEFAKAFPQALNEATEECNCLVFVRSAIVSDRQRAIDLTAVVKRKVGLE